jgi:hypothetical protein
MTAPKLLTLPINGSFKEQTFSDLKPGNFFSFYTGSGACQLLEIVKTFKNGNIKIKYQNSNGIHVSNENPKQWVNSYE